MLIGTQEIYKRIIEINYRKNQILSITKQTTKEFDKTNDILCELLKEYAMLMYAYKARIYRLYRVNDKRLRIVK